jgi:hypothetical protein
MPRTKPRTLGDTTPPVRPTSNTESSKAGKARQVRIVQIMRADDVKDESGDRFLDCIRTIKWQITAT